MQRLRVSVVVVLLATGLSLWASPATAAPLERPSGPKAQPGKYTGTTVDEDGPQRTQFVEFRVTKRGKVVGFRARLAMYCYIGPPVYTQIIPTVIEAPAMKIKQGKVKRGWTEVFEVDGMPETLRGRLVLNFKRGRVASGRIAVDFASCGTTTGEPAGYIPFQVRRR